jgi:hypothetical protein
MAKKDAFTGAKTAFTMFDAYVNTVAQEIGMERAVSLLTKTAENMGTMQGQMMKQQAGKKEFDAKTAASLMNTIPEDLGIEFQVIEESPKRVVLKAGRCPLYEAAQMLGMDAKTIEGMCQASSARFDAMLLKQLNPSLSFRVTKFRSAPGDFCLEEVALA